MSGKNQDIDAPQDVDSATTPGASKARLRRGASLYSDEAVMTLRNFGMTALILRAGTSTQFGTFLVAYLAYQVVVTVNRAFTAEPLMVRAGGSTSMGSRRNASGMAVAIGVGFGLLCGSAAFLFSGEMRTGFLTLAITAPGLLLLDTWRFIFISEGTPFRALAVDVLWAILFAGSVLLVVVQGGAAPSTIFLFWGMAGSVAGIVAAMIGRVPPSIGGAISWIRSTVHLSARYAIEEFGRAFSTWLAFLFVARGVGLEAVGLLGGVVVLFGPLGLVYRASHAFGITEGIRLTSSASANRFRRSGLLMMIAFAIVPFILAFVVSIIPAGFGARIVPNWSQLVEHLFPVAMRVSAVGAIVGLRVMLRVFQAPRMSLRAEVAGGVTLLVATAASVQLGTVDAAAIGMGLGQWLGVPFWIWGVRIALKDRAHRGSDLRVGRHYS